MWAAAILCRRNAGTLVFQSWLGVSEKVAVDEKILALSGWKGAP